jgi:hypothetical protein
MTEAVLALMGKIPAGEVPSNLHRLKQLLEEGSVTDTSYAVPGKFPHGPSSTGRPVSR